MFWATETGPQAGMSCDDPAYVSEQYRDASNPAARTTLRERFSTNRHPWQRWFFDAFDLPDNARILEVGCGPGNLWAENLDRLPTGWDVTLTDASPEMVRDARRRLAEDERCHFRQADARELPFESNTFDAVVANHVRYHVPDRGRALSEMARVLRPTGVLHASTNGRDHNREMGRMLRVLFPERPDDGYHRAGIVFGLENGEEQLSRWYGSVRLLRRQDSLFVTGVGPLVNYLLSGTAAHAAGHGGGVHVTKDTGIFVVRK